MAFIDNFGPFGIEKSKELNYNTLFRWAPEKERNRYGSYSGVDVVVNDTQSDSIQYLNFAKK